MKLNCSKVYDGQSAFRNGLHDAISLPREPNLYRLPTRLTGPNAINLMNRALWRIGRALGGVKLIARFIQP